MCKSESATIPDNMVQTPSNDIRIAVVFSSTFSFSVLALIPVFSSGYWYSLKRKLKSILADVSLPTLKELSIFLPEDSGILLHLQFL
jgi:hypothetical protein